MFTDGAFKIESVDHVWLAADDPRLVKLTVTERVSTSLDNKGRSAFVWRVTLSHNYGESEIASGSVAFTDKVRALGTAIFQGHAAFEQAKAKFDKA